MRRVLFIILMVLALCGTAAFVNFWLKTQPVSVTTSTLTQDKLKSLPGKNQQVINFIETSGRTLAPNYDSVVCTEFVINVLNHFGNLNPKERKLIRIITDENLVTLIESNSSIIKGVQTALLVNDKGFAIEHASQVKPGDFIQFWNIYDQSAYGHCGVVYSLEVNKNITVYSSHPLTNGYGKQTFLWPQKVFFARLN